MLYAMSAASERGSLTVATSSFINPTQKLHVYGRSDAARDGFRPSLIKVLLFGLSAASGRASLTVAASHSIPREMQFHLLLHTERCSLAFATSTSINATRKHHVHSRSDATLDGSHNKSRERCFAASECGFLTVPSRVPNATPVSTNTVSRDAARDGFSTQ
ncbi:hypothetical protein M427DRAFT_410292 [Gonapodya prolifera JEL478]|uniref:Uncharacterized protein n=1 Tax=Gonapodya prolifera (strain JEL478) TaxID=1344416 RepID=A0A139A5Q2_GONPJ|nr:hypothetical protein M427DRAFT_410292 [Gonapodya prolifera JEL478]|eukprot:KXS12084.1 hypothetical protein M427DRAFT_410292 [Gonapodya prolifera JEL478]